LVVPSTLPLLPIPPGRQHLRTETQSLSFCPQSEVLQSFRMGIDPESHKNVPKAGIEATIKYVIPQTEVKENHIFYFTL
jgi:hypothetical protein